jgi:colanic acid/amylovoran biosynthesis protein
MNILLLNNHSVLNAGDHAILLETLRLLDAAFPGAQVTLAFNDVASARVAHPSRPVVASPVAQMARITAAGQYQMAPHGRRRELVRALLGAALAYRSGRASATLRQPQAAFVQALAEADLVLASGGGYFFTATIEGLFGWYTFTILGALMAVLMRKPLVLLPQSFGPLHTPAQRLAVALIARSATLTFAREPISYAFLEQWRAAHRALLAPDLAIAMPGASPDEGRVLLEQAGLWRSRPEFTVGFTVMNWAGQFSAFDAQRHYEQALAGGLDAITAAGGNAVLFGQSLGPTAAEDDRGVIERLRAAVRRPERVIPFAATLDPRRLQAAYGCVDYFVGTRMHSLIMALNAGTPAMAIAYLHKTNGFLAEVGLAHRGLEISTVTAAELAAAFEQLRAAPEQPGVVPYLARARRFKQALVPLLHAVARR